MNLKKASSWLAFMLILGLQGHLAFVTLGA